MKNTLSNKVSVIDTDSDYVLWVKIDKSAFHLNEDLYCGIVYVPPSDSRFYTNDESARFEAEITSMCIEHKYVLLNGDFNARSKNCADYVDADDFLTQFFNTMNHYWSFIIHHLCLKIVPIFHKKELLKIVS